MLRNFFSSLENPDHPLLGPNLWGLQICGLWQSSVGTWKIIYNVVHIAAVFFVFSQYVELWIIRSELAMALRNLSITMLSSICVIKAGTFVYYQDVWKDIINYVSSLEKQQLSTNNKTTREIIRQYTKYSRYVTYLYWILVTVTVFTVILAPLAGYITSSECRELTRNGTLPYPEIMSSWVPFNKNRGFGYFVLIIEQILICFYGGSIVANHDSNAVGLMSFFSGQLKLLTENCSKIFGDKNEIVSHMEAIKRIKACHNHYLGLIRHAEKFNFLLSPVMFVYVIISSLMICASAIQLEADNATNMQKIWIVEYLTALITQLFLYCWHGNEVFTESDKVSYGVYKSKWWSRNAVERRCALLLTGQLNRRIVFSAGPFTTLTISTFVSIIKGAYSYYTLLSKK